MKKKTQKTQLPASDTDEIAILIFIKSQIFSVMTLWTHAINTLQKTDFIAMNNKK